MARFRYRGRTERGEPIEGYLEAGTSDAVADQLLDGGVTPVDIVEAPASRDWGSDLKRALSERRPSLVDLQLLCRQMYSLMHAGVPIARAMRGLAETTRNPVLARALADVLENLESGRELAASLRRHADVFPSLLVSIVQVGEASGRLSEAFLHISRHLEREIEARERVRAALRYPTIVLAAVAVAIAVINVVVIPAFARVFAGFDARLPLPTRILIGVSDFTMTYWPVLLAASIAAALAVRAYLRSERGRYRWDRLKLRLPIAGGIVHRATLARYARAFAMAMRSGVPMVQTMTVVSRAVDNEFVADRLLIMRNAVERGESLTRSAATTGLFTPLVLQMMAVGEETGQIDDLLDEVGAFYEREVDHDLKTLSQSIEPILITAVGVMVLILALGVFLPMWDLAQAARGG